MHLTLQFIRTLPVSVKGWYAREFGEPVSPYTKLDPDFRRGLEEHATLSMLEKLAIQLEKRYGFRINSVSNQLLMLTVFLTSTFMLYDTITDTMTSIGDKWARPFYIPGLVMVTVGIRHLIYAVRPAPKELDPDKKYASDEAGQAAVAIFGSSDLKAVADSQIASSEPEPKDVSVGRVEEVASRTSHDREMLWRRRTLMDKSLVAVLRAIVLTTAATCLYVIVGLFV